MAALATVQDRVEFAAKATEQYHRTKVEFEAARMIWANALNAVEDAEKAALSAEAWVVLGMRDRAALSTSSPAQQRIHSYDWSDGVPSSR